MVDLLLLLRGMAEDQRIVMMITIVIGEEGEVVDDILMMIQLRKK